MALHRIFQGLGYASLLAAAATAVHGGAGGFGIQIGVWQFVAVGLGFAFFVAGGVVTPEKQSDK